MVIALNAAGEPIGEDLPEHLSFNMGVGNPLDHHTELELRQMARQWGQEAQRSYDASIVKLHALARACSPVKLLCHFAYYDTAYHENHGDGSEYSPAGQHHVEILQALILTISERELQYSDPTTEQRMQVNEELKAVSSGFALKRLATDSDSATIIREQARAGTQIVRNPGSQGQILRNLKELFAPLDRLLQASKGVTFTGLIAVCEGFMDQVVARLNSHRQVLQRVYQQPTREEMIDEFGDLFGLPAEKIAYLKEQDALHSSTLENTKIGLFNYSEWLFPSIFSATLDELVSMYPEEIERETLRKALVVWTLKFGSLQSATIEHLFLNNPIWSKPFIETADGCYFWPIFHSFVAFGLEMLEAQMEGDQHLKNAYYDRRTDFTEDKAAELLKEFGPGMRLMRNLQWRDPQTGKQMENDILILIDTHAIIVECKSGRIKDAARRGGRSLEEHLKKLIQEPTEQGYRFEQFLRAQRGSIRLEDKKGEAYEIDSTGIFSYTRLNVLLDFWGSLACQDKLLREIGIIDTNAPAAVSMALVDLENLLYLIDSPAQRLHYLYHRAALERRFEIIGDELDLIAYYLGSGRWPADQQTKMNLASASNQVDPFLLRRDLDLSRKAPKLKLNKWWADMLKRMETKTFHGWTEAAIVLLSFPLDNQEKYWSLVQSTLVDTALSPERTQGREIICAACPTADDLVGLASHVTTMGTREQNREKTERAMNALAEMNPKPNRLVALTIFSECYPYATLKGGSDVASSGCCFCGDNRGWLDSASRFGSF